MLNTTHSGHEKSKYYIFMYISSAFSANRLSVAILLGQTEASTRDTCNVPTNM